jgi:hypothetical protein
LWEVVYSAGDFFVTVYPKNWKQFKKEEEVYIAF